jgi:hypothetical protein
MSKHLIVDNSKIKQVKGFAPYKREVTLHYYEQPFYSRLMKKVLEELKEKAPKFL